MLIRSRGVWISSRSGPMDTQSSPGIFPASRPHSTPGVDGLHLGRAAVLLPEHLDHPVPEG